jgi:hypothetical protein
VGGLFFSDAQPQFGIIETRPRLGAGPTRWSHDKAQAVAKVTNDGRVKIQMSLVGNFSSANVTASLALPVRLRRAHQLQHPAPPTDPYDLLAWKASGFDPALMEAARADH